MNQKKVEIILDLIEEIELVSFCQGMDRLLFGRGDEYFHRQKHLKELKSFVKKHLESETL